MVWLDGDETVGGDSSVKVEFSDESMIFSAKKRFSYELQVTLLEFVSHEP